MKAAGLTKETILDLGVEPRAFPDFNVGDRIEVSLIVKDKNKERIQKFEGDVICFRNHGIATTFTVRKIANEGVGVEMILPYHTPDISSIKLIRQGKVRRAKIFYQRDRLGAKANKIKALNKF